MNTYVYMIVDIIYEEKIGGNNRIYSNLKLYLKCDECHIEYQCPNNIKTRSIRQLVHFCSKSCSSKSMVSGVLRSKVEKTMMMRYGHKGYVATKEFKEKFTSDCLQKYGVKSHLEVPEILNKIKKTCLQKYGKETFVGTPAHISKLDYHEIARKAWETKLKNGKNKKISSKQEEGMFLLLCSEFGKENIVRGKRLLRQFVDFYVKTIDLYIQIDGVYWHGLNRDLEEIMKFKTIQDKHIYQHYLRDKKLNAYCKENNIALIRITDEEFDNTSEDAILKIVKGTQ